MWSCLGLALESAHAWKWAWLFDDEMGRLLLRLAHAHGVGLSLVVLAHAATAVQYSSGALLRPGALLLPLGFLLGAVAHPESDPSLGILLAPVGALLILGDLFRIAWRACRHKPLDR